MIINSTAGGASEWTDGGPGGTGPLYPADNVGRQDVVIGGQSVGAADILLGYAGNAVFNQQKSSAGNFRVGSEYLSGAILVDAGTNQIILASDSTTAGAENLGSDVRLFISGAKYSKGGGAPGVALIGGDAVVSGALHILSLIHI